jgi:hypothetical protein
MITETEKMVTGGANTMDPRVQLIKTDQCMSKMADSYNEYHLRYFKGVTTGQLVDGLDSFYADYRNRRILIVNAVYLVVNSFAGTPQEVMDAATEDLRRKAR